MTSLLTLTEKVQESLYTLYNVFYPFIQLR